MNETFPSKGASIDSEVSVRIIDSIPISRNNFLISAMSLGETIPVITFNLEFGFEGVAKCS